MLINLNLAASPNFHRSPLHSNCALGFGTQPRMQNNRNTANPHRNCWPALSCHPWSVLTTHAAPWRSNIIQTIIHASGIATKNQGALPIIRKRCKARFTTVHNIPLRWTKCPPILIAVNPRFAWKMLLARSFPLLFFIGCHAIKGLSTAAQSVPCTLPCQMQV